MDEWVDGWMGGWMKDALNIPSPAIYRLKRAAEGGQIYNGEDDDDDERRDGERERGGRERGGREIEREGGREKEHVGVREGTKINKNKCAKRSDVIRSIGKIRN